VEIQRIVRANFAALRKCYEDGLRKNPWLQGRVSTRFVIDREGLVSNVVDGGSNLPAATVVSCVLQGFRGLRFPRPENGIVTVTYPIQFTPGAIEQGPKAKVASGIFRGCEASRGEESGGIEARIFCTGYRLRFQEIPTPFRETEAEAAFSDLEHALGVSHSDRGSTALGGASGPTATAVVPGTMWGKIVIVPVGDARHRAVECMARPTADGAVEACEEAIQQLATATTLDSVLPR
jgi:hypothetical protein